MRPLSPPHTIRAAGRWYQRTAVACRYRVYLWNIPGIKPELWGPGFRQNSNQVPGIYYTWYLVPGMYYLPGINNNNSCLWYLVLTTYYILLYGFQMTSCTLCMRWVRQNMKLQNSRRMRIVGGCLFLGNNTWINNSEVAGSLPRVVLFWGRIF